MTTDADSADEATRLAADPPTVSIEHWAVALGIGTKAVLTARETADVLRISERSVRDRIKDGAIPSIRIGGRVLVPVPMLLRSLLQEPEPT